MDGCELVDVRKHGTSQFAFDYEARAFAKSLAVHADCFDWLLRVPENSIHAVVTDPPYGVKEYDADQLTKRANGKGGIWRIPPSFDGHARAPLPRFTALDASEHKDFAAFLPNGPGSLAVFCFPAATSSLRRTPSSLKCFTTRSWLGGWSFAAK
jgi:hypothetical protein